MADRNKRTTKKDVYSIQNRNSEFTYCRGGVKTCGLLVSDTDQSMLCDICLTWYHRDCQGLTQAQYNHIKAIIDDISWACMGCKRSSKRQNDKINAVNTKVDKLTDDVNDMKQELKKLDKKATQSDSTFKTMDQKLRKLEEEVTDLRQGSHEEVVKQFKETTKKLEEKSKKKHLEFTNSLYETKNLEFKNKNLIVANMPEVEEASPKKVAKAEFKQMKDALGDKVDDLIPEDIMYIKRLSERSDEPRKMLIRFKNLEMRKKLLGNSKNLKIKKGDLEYNIYITLDRTKAQNKKLFDLRREKKRRADQGETDLVI